MLISRCTWHRELVRLQWARYGNRPPGRPPLPAERQFLAQQASSTVACDFLTVDTVWLKRIYVPVFIELATRRVHLTGCTANPELGWPSRRETSRFTSTNEKIR